MEIKIWFVFLIIVILVGLWWRCFQSEKIMEAFDNMCYVCAQNRWEEGECRREHLEEHMRLSLGKFT